MDKKELIGFERRIEKLYSKGKIRAPVHLSGNNEEQLIEIFKKINKKDWVFSTYRNHYHALLHGISPERLEKKIIEGESMHIMSKEPKFFSSSIVGGHLPIALGTAMALKRKKLENKVWAFCGDMAAESGIFYEVVKYATWHKLPINFIIEDNGLAVYTPTNEVWGGNTGCLSFTYDKEGSAQNKNSDSVVTKYTYERAWPHHGIGMWIDFPDERRKDPAYRKELNKAMKLLAKDKKTVFIGQTVEYDGSLMYKTLKDMPKKKKVELPVMEEVQMGISIGMALENYIPISVYPRFDFLTLATNQLVNHLDKISELSNGEFNPKVIIRTMVGSRNPLYPGPQHCQDHTEAYRKMLTNIDIVKLENSADIMLAYKNALEKSKSSLIVELADLF